MINKYIYANCYSHFLKENTNKTNHNWDLNKNKTPSFKTIFWLLHNCNGILAIHKFIL